MKIKGFFAVLIVLSVALLALWGCPKQTEVSSTPEEVKADQATSDQKIKEEADRERARQERAREEQAREEQAREQAAAEASKGLQPVYFDFDRAIIRQEGLPVMKANAECLKAHPGVKVRIEGNCDERGTIEYNQALGQRRAVSAKKYLTDLGVSGSRISLISYGKEKQVCMDHSEACWQKNRRDDFIVE